MKKLIIDVPDELKKSLKHEAINQNRTLRSLVIERLSA